MTNTTYTAIRSRYASLVGATIRASHMAHSSARLNTYQALTNDIAHVVFNLECELQDTSVFAQIKTLADEVTNIVFEIEPATAREAWRTLESIKALALKALDVAATITFPEESGKVKAEEFCDWLEMCGEEPLFVEWVYTNWNSLPAYAINSDDFSKLWDIYENT